MSQYASWCHAVNIRARPCFCDNMKSAFGILHKDPTSDSVSNSRNQQPWPLKSFSMPAAAMHWVGRGVCMSMTGIGEYLKWSFIYRLTVMYIVIKNDPFHLAFISFVFDKVFISVGEPVGFAHRGKMKSRLRVPAQLPAFVILCAYNHMNILRYICHFFDSLLQWKHPVFLWWSFITPTFATKTHSVLMMKIILWCTLPGAYLKFYRPILKLFMFIFCLKLAQAAVVELSLSLIWSHLGLHVGMMKTSHSTLPCSRTSIL